MNDTTPTANHSLSQWLTYMGNIHVSAIDMGLERVLPVARALGLFELEHTPYVFTVAGTNGKGSTTATIAEICTHAGYKTALYQSPHLVSFNERIKINGTEVLDDVLINAFVAVENARQNCHLSLSFFEMTTLAAFYVFAQARCDVWVLEIGLGGRLDVVNIITPNVCVITNVGIDHVDWLGDTKEKIGFEKAGILRPNAVLIYGDDEMPDSVKHTIAKQQATCYQRGQHFIAIDDTDGDTWVYSSQAITWRLPKPKISLENASTAVSAILGSDLPINNTAIAKGLQSVQLAGRFDKRQLEDRTWLFDVAHNEAGVIFLLKQFVPFWQNQQKQHPHARLHLLFSMLADKDVDSVLSLLGTLPITHLHTAAIDNVRALSANDLSQKITHILPKTALSVHACLADGTHYLQKHSQPHDVILVLGSFYTISESLIALGQYLNFQPN